MKFVIVLLAAVALATAAPQERGILDTVGSLISDFTSSVYGTLEEMVASVTKLAVGTLTRSDGIVSTTLNQIASLTGVVQSQLDALVARGGNAKTCALNQITQLTNIRTTAVSNAYSCVTDVTRAVNNFEDDMFARIASVRSDLGSLVSLATNCIKELLGAITCAISKINTGYLIVDNLINTVNGAVSGAQLQFDTALNNAQMCANNVVDTATRQVQTITENMKRCI